MRACLKDVLEIDAGVIVKVYSLDSFDFEHLEPRSGAPLLKPLQCPVCNAEGQTDGKTIGEKAYKTLDSIIKTEKKLRKLEKELGKLIEELPESNRNRVSRVEDGKKSPSSKISRSNFCISY